MTENCESYIHLLGLVTGYVDVTDNLKDDSKYDEGLEEEKL